MDCYIGAIFLFAGNYAPQDFLLCEGQILPIQQYAALYSILGIQYGGDGSRTFALPNLPKVPDTDGRGESRYIICINGLYPCRP